MMDYSDEFQDGSTSKTFCEITNIQLEKFALHSAVDAFNHGVVQALLEAGANVNERNEENITPLYIAAKYEDKAACELLLNYRADPDAADQNGQTPLLLAVESLNYEITELLLEKKADANKGNILGITPIFIAARFKNTLMCKLLLKFGADASVVSHDGKSPLIVAVEENRTETAELLLLHEHGVNVNHCTKNGFSAIYEAAVWGNKQIFLALLKRGAEIDITMQRNNRTILHHGVFKECLEIVETVLRHCKILDGKFNSLLRSAIIKRTEKSEKIVKNLMFYGLRLSKKDIHYPELVSAVIMKGYVGLFFDLLHFGLDINMIVQTTEGCGHNRAAPRAENGRAASREDNGGSSLLEIAVHFKQHKIADLLISRGANVNCHSPKKGLTPLHKAVSNGDVAMVKLLLKFDADCNVVDDDGVTPLHVATMKGKPEILKLLLSSGADISTADNEKCTVFDYINRNPSIYLMLSGHLQHHLVKLKAANLCKDQKLLSLPTNLCAQDYENKCLAEVALLKNIRIGNLSVSLYDILTGSFTELIDVLKVENLKDIFQVEMRDNKYPIYGPLINHKLVRARRRRSILDSYERIIRSYFPLLPEIISFRIVSFLTNQEIKKLLNLHCKSRPEGLYVVKS